MIKLTLSLALLAMLGCAPAPVAPERAAPVPTPPPAPTATPTPALDASWGALRDLVGAWEGASEQEQSKGTMTLTPDLGGQVLVRRGTNDSPRGHHEDLTIIRRADGGTFRADYFDNEGHVIRYLVQPRPGGVVFVSEIRPGEPRYRLTYTRADDATITGGFEVAPPGRPDEFAAYLSWRARKIR